MATGRPDALRALYLQSLLRLPDHGPAGPGRTRSERADPQGEGPGHFHRGASLDVMAAAIVTRLLRRGRREGPLGDFARPAQRGCGALTVGDGRPSARAAVRG